MVVRRGTVSPRNWRLLKAGNCETQGRESRAAPRPGNSDQERSDWLIQLRGLIPLKLQPSIFNNLGDYDDNEHNERGRGGRNRTSSQGDPLSRRTLLH